MKLPKDAPQLGDLQWQTPVFGSGSYGYWRGSAHTAQLVLERGLKEKFLTFADQAQDYNSALNRAMSQNSTGGSDHLLLRGRFPQFAEVIDLLPRLINHEGLGHVAAAAALLRQGNLEEVAPALQERAYFPFRRTEWGDEAGTDRAEKAAAEALKTALQSPEDGALIRDRLVDLVRVTLRSTQGTTSEPEGLRQALKVLEKQGLVLPEKLTLSQPAVFAKPSSLEVELSPALRFAALMGGFGFRSSEATGTLELVRPGKEPGQEEVIPLLSRTPWWPAASEDLVAKVGLPSRVTIGVEGDEIVTKTSWHAQLPTQFPWGDTTAKLEDGRYVASVSRPFRTEAGEQIDAQLVVSLSVSDGVISNLWRTPDVELSDGDRAALAKLGAERFDELRTLLAFNLIENEPTLFLHRPGTAVVTSANLQSGVVKEINLNNLIFPSDPTKRRWRDVLPFEVPSSSAPPPSSDLSPLLAIVLNESFDGSGQSFADRIENLVKEKGLEGLRKALS